MKILSWNVNGLRSILTKGFTRVIAEENPDLVCLQETKIQDNHIEAIAADMPPGRWEHSHAVKKGYSGVATLHVSRAAKMLVHERGIGKKNFDSEGRFIISEHPEFTLYNIYFPSGTSGEERQAFKYSFLKAFYRHLSDLTPSKRSRVVLCGDFNICHREIDIHHPAEATKRGLTGFLPDERKWMTSLCELGFVDCFRHVHGDLPHQYTWWTFRAGARKKNLGWRIDYFFVSKALADKITAADILSDVQGSDHCPITLELRL